MKILCTDYSLTDYYLTINAGFPFTIENILLVTDVDANDILYNFADPLRGGTLVGNVLTLEYSGGAGTGTKLQIYLDDGKAPAADDTVQALLTVAENLERLTVLMQRSIMALSLPDASGRVRVVADAGAGSLSVVMSSGTVTNLTNVVYSANDLIPSTMKLAAANLRSNITTN